MNYYLIIGELLISRCIGVMSGREQEIEESVSVFKERVSLVLEIRMASSCVACYLTPGLVQKILVRFSC